jgi:hypothetical protein
MPEDEAFVGLFADYYASHHVFAADGEGAVAIERLLHASAPLKGQKTILYADTGDPVHQHRLRLTALPSTEVIVFTSIAVLLHWLNSFDLRSSAAVRLYVAGSRTLIRLIVELSTTAGLPQERVLMELCNPIERNVECSRCETVTRTVDAAQLLCSCCGTELRISNYYSAASGTYLGRPLCAYER